MRWSLLLIGLVAGDSKIEVLRGAQQFHLQFEAITTTYLHCDAREAFQAGKQAIYDESIEQL